MQPKPETIAAIATAPGRGGIGVVRISGANLQVFAEAVCGRAPQPRLATLAKFLDRQNQVLDEGIVLYFPAPNSYTGEDVVELQGHGGPAVLQSILQRCLELGARMAEPGEFTKRAYLNGKMDLTQAESVADLIDATTTQAARSAVRSLQGDFSAATHALVKKLVHLRMLAEAMLDFPEEELDVDDIALRRQKIEELQKELAHIFSVAQQGCLLREGAHVVLVGQPNVGKSSLLNRLSGDEVAIVSDIPGTTRDVIRQAIQLNGVPLHLIDTAGLRESDDTVEKIGIDRTRKTVQQADAILLLVDATQGITAEDRAILETLPPQIPLIRVYNKIDLIGHAAEGHPDSDAYDIYLSARTGAGIELLQQRLLQLIGWHQEAGVFMARERHLHALRSAQESIALAEQELARPECCAEELRRAQETLNTITGEFTPDDLLGEIFKNFCIGK